MNFIIKKKGSETMSFQENLRYYREKAGYKQAKDFAEALNIPYSTYTGYEVRNREPKYETLCRIADLLKVSTDDLLGRTTNILGNKDDYILLNKIKFLLDIAKERNLVNIKISNINDENIFFKNIDSSIDINFFVNKQLLIKTFNNIEKFNNNVMSSDLITFLSNIEKEQIISKLNEKLIQASLITNEKERNDKMKKIISAIKMTSLLKINTDNIHKNLFELCLDK